MKRILSFVLAAALVAALCCGCTGQGGKQSPEVDRITATDAMTSSYLYMIVEQKGIDEVMDVYNSFEYRPSDEEFDWLAKMLNVTMFHGDDIVAQFTVTPDGLLTLDGDPDRVYRITSDFDYDAFRELFVYYSVDF